MQTLTDKAVALIAYLDKNAKPEQKPNDAPTVAQLLAQSRNAHAVYRRALRHRENGVTIDGDPAVAAEAVVATARLRAHAEILDPKHTDPAWADELKTTKFPHTAMMEFYADEVKYYVPLVADVKAEPAPDAKPVEEMTPDAETRTR